MLVLLNVSQDNQGNDGDVRVSPSAATGSHPPDMNGAATESTCWGVRTISNAEGILDPPMIS
jgi:hypothetical protein